LLALRLHADGLKVEEIETPSPDLARLAGACACCSDTRDELEVVRSIVFRDCLTAFGRCPSDSGD